METKIKDLAKSKLAGYIAFIFYLGFLGLAATGDEWFSLLCLVIAVVVAIIKIFYEVRFTWRVSKNE